ncbi:MAG: hypothetical protein WCS75_03390 [Sphingomonas sp.]|uniref:hypothetical protein n=1 Tax=Sphingomonas sp. TaxID=28214 RepID=UPI0035699129
MQTQRLEGTALRTHADLDGDLLEAHAMPDEAGHRQLMQTAEAERISERASNSVTPRNKAKAALSPAI